MAWLLLLILLLGMLPSAVFATSYVAQVDNTQYTTLADAVANANKAEESVTLTLLDDIELGETPTITGDVTIEGEYTITRSNSYTGTLFTVESGAVLTLNDLTIDGNNKWTFAKESYKDALDNVTQIINQSAFVTSEENAPIANADMITVNGTVIMNGSTIKNHMCTSGNGVFSVNKNAVLTMNGATVTHNTHPNSSVVASVASGAVWTINGETVISDNHSGSNGGVVRVDNGKVVMNGGSVKKNTGVNNNGTFIMLYGTGATFELNDGKICSHSGVYGKNNGRCAAI